MSWSRVRSFASKKSAHAETELVGQEDFGSRFPVLGLHDVAGHVPAELVLDNPAEVLRTVIPLLARMAWRKSGLWSGSTARAPPPRGLVHGLAADQIVDVEARRLAADLLDGQCHAPLILVGVVDVDDAVKTAAAAVDDPLDPLELAAKEIGAVRAQASSENANDIRSM